MVSNVICGNSVWFMGYKLNVVSEPALELWRGYESLANFQNDNILTLSFRPLFKFLSVKKVVNL